MADRPVVLLGVTGGIAAYKAAELLRGLQKAGMEVRVIMTRTATQFVGPMTFEALSGAPVRLDRVSELRAEEQEVFLLRQNGQMTYDEIAESIGIPTGTVKTRMRLAITKLRETLAKTA